MTTLRLQWPWFIERDLRGRCSVLRGVNMGCDPDVVASNMSGPDAMLFVNSVIAIETAAQRLGLDPAVLAERLAKGGIAELVEALSSLRSEDVSEGACNEADAALQPFSKE
jgi:hypothetical protein